MCVCVCVCVCIYALGNEPGADLGPLISPEAKQRVCDLVQSGKDEGASVSTFSSVCGVWCWVDVCCSLLSAVLVQVVLDGRDIVVPGYEKGNFVGPTIITEVKVCAAISWCQSGL